MRSFKGLGWGFLLPIFLLCIPGTSEAVVQTIEKGIEHMAMRVFTVGGPAIVNVLRVSPKFAEVATVMAGGTLGSGPYRGRDFLSSMVRNSGAICGINGDYFTWMGFPFGIQVSDGELLISPMRNKAAFAIMDNGTAAVDIPVFSGRFYVEGGLELKISTLNRPQKEGAVLYTPSYGSEVEDPGNLKVVLIGLSLPIRPVGRYEGVIAEVTEENGIFPPPDGVVLSVPKDLLKGKVMPKEGQKAIVEVEVYSKKQGKVKWEKVIQAIGGGPIILKDGRPAGSWREEEFKDSFVRARHPRTAIGVSSDGTIILLTVDGRSRWSCGATISDLTMILKELGAVDAMNLDGGGATEMIIKDRIVNNPSEGTERAIKNAVIVRKPPSNPSSVKEASIVPSPLLLLVGEEIPLSVTGIDSKGKNFLIDGRWIGWEVEGENALLKPGGKLVGIRPGTGSIRCVIGDVELEAELIVLPGLPRRIRWSADGSNIKVAFMDLGYNPVPNIDVTVAFYSSGERIRNTIKKTDEGGVIDIEIPKDIRPDFVYVETKNISRRIRLRGMLGS